MASRAIGSIPISGSPSSRAIDSIADLKRELDTRGYVRDVRVAVYGTVAGKRQGIGYLKTTVAELRVLLASSRIRRGIDAVVDIEGSTAYAVRIASLPEHSLARRRHMTIWIR